jgi:hypothetical protein
MDVQRYEQFRKEIKLRPIAIAMVDNRWYLVLKLGAKKASLNNDSDVFVGEIQDIRFCETIREAQEKIDAS